MGCRCGSDLVLLWLWCRSADAALIHPLAWELTYAEDAALKRQNKQTNKNNKTNASSRNPRGVPSVVQWDRWCLWSAGSIPGPAQWVKDPALTRLRHMSQLRLGSDSWPRNSYASGKQKEKKRKKERKKERKKQTQGPQQDWVVPERSF